MNLRFRPALLLLATVAFGQEDPQERLAAGKAAEDAKRFDEAERAYRSGLASARDPALEAQLTLGIARIREQYGKYSEARPLYESALAKFPMGSPGRAETEFRLGLVCANLRDNKAAILHLGSARIAFEKAGNPGRAAAALDVLGQLAAQSGDPQSAERYLTEALDIYTRINNRRGIAKAQSSLAFHYSRQSSFRKAFQYGFLALDGNREAGDDQEVAKVLEILGQVYSRLEQHEKAYEHFQEALAIREKSVNRDQVAFLYNSLATALVNLGKLQEAKKYHEKGLAIRRQAGNPRNLAQTLYNIGIVDELLGHLQEALKDYQEALAICRKGGFQPDAADVLFQLGGLAFQDNRLDDALKYHRESLDIRKRMNDGRRIVRSQAALGRVLEKQGDASGAAIQYEAAIHDLEKLGMDVVDPTRYGIFREMAAGLYPQYASLLATQGKMVQALEISERGRGAGLGRMLALNRAPRDPAQLHEWDLAKQRFSQAANVLAKSNESTASQAAAAYFDARQDLWRVRDRMLSFADSGTLDTLTGDGKQILDFASRHPDTLMLEWTLLDSRSTLLFSVSSKGITYQTLSTGFQEWSEMIEGWRKGLIAPVAADSPRIRDRLRRQESEMARALFDRLLGTMQSELAGFKRLVLVADGPLLEIAFPALLDTRGRRLIENFTTVQAVSLGSFVKPRAVSAGGKALVIADPISPGQIRVAGSARERFESLPQARREGKTVSQLFPGGTLLVGSAAREPQIKAQIGNFDILHFATHGVSLPAGTLEQGILLAEEEPASSDDGVLYAWEVAELNLKARLAVLSACETLKGRNQSGEGLVGFAWAFQAAGVNSVLASLWNVADESSGVLMGHLYRNLRQTDTAEALRRAMLAVRNDKRFHEAYYWAAFQMFHPGSSW